VRDSESHEVVMHGQLKLAGTLHACTGCCCMSAEWQRRRAQTWSARP
jgi:hypothetical protein